MAMLSPAEDECFANLPHDFLICTTIHKARNIGLFTSHLYVRVTFDKIRRHTKVFSHSENPFFNEYFVYEMKCTLSELLRNTILYEMRQQSKCKKNVTIGELLIDMNSVWNQPNRCYFKKWGLLEPPVGKSGKAVSSRKTIVSATDPTGKQTRSFLQIDLAIVSQTTKPESIMKPYAVDSGYKWHDQRNYDDIETNLLQSLDPSIQCNIVYVVSFYRGYFVQKADYCVQFRFNPFKGKTSVQKQTNRPVWNEAMTFAWTYPSLAQTLNLQVLSHEHLQWKVVAEYDLQFDDIAFKAKPALGPAFIHLYDPHASTVYQGRILLQIHSECVEKTIRRELVNKTIDPIEEERFWSVANFQTEFVALQGDFLRGNISNCKIILKLAETTSNHVECYLKSYTATRQRLTNLKYFRQEAPYKSVSLFTLQPDNRTKFESDFFMQEILDYIKNEIETFKLFQLKYAYQHQVQMKCLKAILLAILGKIRDGLNTMRLDAHGFQQRFTVWDKNRLIYLKEFFKRFQEVLRQLKIRLKNTNTHQIANSIEGVLQDLVHYSNELATLMSATRVQDDWPDLLILLLAPGNKEMGVCRLNAKYYVNGPKQEEEAESWQTYCWQLRNFVFKDMHCHHTCAHCGCTVAIIQGCLSIIEADKEREEYIRQQLSIAWKQPESFYWNPIVPHSTFRCRFFIHSAKVRPGSDRSGLCDAFVRIVFGTQCAETPTEKATLSPIWNAVIAFERVILAGPAQWYMQNPPLVCIELYDLDKYNTHDYLGCGVFVASVIGPTSVKTKSGDNDPNNNLLLSELVQTKQAFHKFEQLKTLSPPPLKWIPIAQDGCVRAEVLISAELVEGSAELAQTGHSEPTVSQGIPSAIKPTMRNFALEVVFAGFRNYTRTTLISKHRIKVMMGELLLTSGLSSVRMRNTINFLMIYASGVVSLPEQLEYWPAIIVTDVVVTGRNTESTMGAALISNSRRFLHRNMLTKCLPLTVDDRVPAPTMLMVNEDDDDNDTKPLLSMKRARGLLYGVVGMFSKNQIKPTEISDQSNTAVEKNEFESEYSWWTKFYNSVFLDTNIRHSFKHSLTVYSGELERELEFSHLIDWAEPLPMVYGAKFKKNNPCHEQVYATLKLQLKITQCVCSPGVISGGTGDCGDAAGLRALTPAQNPKYQARIQQIAEQCKVVVRIYIVQGLQFRPHDRYSQSDAYVRLHLGNKTTSNRAHYIPNQSNPIFGHCFQMDGTLPKDHYLEVTVFDRNPVCDDVIGTTVIDLEDRWRTRHRATVGIAHRYSSSGYNKWRDVQTPLQILSQYCAEYDIPEPAFKGRTIECDGVAFSDESNDVEDLHERLSLIVLRHFDRLPSFGYKLIPEHVETRSLYRQDCPGIEQGKLQMWIEMYEANINLPAALDITPQPAKIFELRMIVYNCKDVVLNEQNVFGKSMSDIFVKRVCSIFELPSIDWDQLNGSWCSDPNQAQATDIHYRSLNGEAAFNWRMIFPVKYSAVDGMMVSKRHGGVFGDYEMKFPPMLYIEVWDNDLISANDFLGMVEINLDSFSLPYPSEKNCSLSDYDKRKIINLFHEKKVRGWLPLKGPVTAGKSTNKIKSELQKGMTGKIEIELQILSDSEAAADPVGLARSPPKPMPAPIRPDTSFNPFMNPMKSVQKILLPVLRRYALICCGVILLVVVVIGAVYSIPSIIDHIMGDDEYYYTRH